MVKNSSRRIVALIAKMYWSDKDFLGLLSRIRDVVHNFKKLQLPFSTGRNRHISRSMIHVNRLQTVNITPMIAKITRQTMPNMRTCLLQSLQTSDGHHGDFKVTRNPIFPSKPTEPRSSSDFCFLQLAQVNTA